MSFAEHVAERFPTLSRQLAVLRESWRLQNEADKSRKPIAEHEFLPAALEIMEKPPSPGLRWLMLILCSLFTIAILWSIIGRVDVVAVASGKVIPAANVKIIQPMEIGAVRAIHVRNGERVKKGQLLLELDPTLAGADEAQATQGLLSARIAEARNDALLAHLSGRPMRFVAPPGTPAAIAQTQDQLVRTAIAEYQAERASLGQTRAERGAELSGAQAEIAKLRQTLPLIDQQLAARKQLAEKGHFSRLKLLEYEQLRVEHIQNIAVQESVAAKARAAIGNLDAQLARLRETFGKAAVTELAEAEDRSSVAASELRKSERRREFQQLRSPVNGTVQQLAVNTVGGVVQPAQPLMVIVPAEAAIAVEVQILNKDIGFVREGQPVRVKLEAFPFTDYGIIHGLVESISRDAIQDEKLGLVYAARIRLSRATIEVGGAAQAIGPGLAVQAEIKTGARRIIQYLLSPISQTLSEAGRER
jgi:hemolysin D